ncbi:cell polarity factor Rax2 [Schizosaccharomyces cryophilus OY26]|uniref:Cell polarity factor Rax2 n=1 Tax=Schizosaccharomyces cryophilus (strain OY26 / ATCC MYA-4695 / CBS 11777 / NBRC 106824 / NRRL Y48691) TaxID=653667 RepID=S9W3T7_SCHCR|nr:cell polarity factor Rax2 [Schizosaccharomyces cryophilus OY26]EPY53199.1 cell polarity factor Rax2 [Schizosaccharomyces cryophilus OY26]
MIMGIAYSQLQLRFHILFAFVLVFLYYVFPVVSYDVSFLGPFVGFNYLSEPIVSANTSYQLYKQYRNGSWTLISLPLPSFNDFCFTTIPDDNKSYLPIFDRLNSSITVHELFSNTSYELNSHNHSSTSSHLHSIFCDDYSPFLYGLVNASNLSTTITELYRWNLTDPFSAAEYVYSFNGNVSSVLPTASDEIAVYGNFTRSTPFIPTDQIQIAKVGFRSSTLLSESSTSTSVMDLSCYSDNSLFIWDVSYPNSVSLNSWALYQIEFYSIRIFTDDIVSFSATSFHLTNSYDKPVPLTYKPADNSSFISCSFNCSLDSSKQYHDFYFPEGWTDYEVNVHLYNDAPGADLVAVKGIQFFQKNAVSYFDNSFNQDACQFPGYNSLSKHTGIWKPSTQNASMPYWISSPSLENATATFIPNITYSSNVSLDLMVPGCHYDDTCSYRNDAVVKVHYAENASPSQKVISQRYSYNKYIRVYSGFVQGSSSSFRPYVEILPFNNSSLVAHSLRCEENIWDETSKGLVFLSFSHPNNSMRPSNIFTTDDISSEFVNAVQNCSLGICIGGDFNSKYGRNLIYINSSKVPKSFPGWGMDGAVTDILDYGGVMYISGLFQSLSDQSQVLNYVAQFNNGIWEPLGFGTNGAVRRIRTSILYELGQPVTYISFQGNFNTVYNKDNTTLTVDGYALWNPSSQSWLGNTDLNPYFSGTLQSIATKNDSTIRLGKLNALADYSTNSIMYFSTPKAATSFVPDYLRYIPSDLHLQSVTNFFQNTSMVILATINQSTQDNTISKIYMLNKTGVSFPKQILESNESISKVTAIADELYILFGDYKDPYLENGHYRVFNATANTLVNTTYLTKLRGKIDTILPSYTQCSFTLFGGNISTLDNSCQGLCHLNSVQKTWQQVQYNYSRGIVHSMEYMNDEHTKLLVGGDFSFEDGRKEYLMIYDTETQTLFPFSKDLSILGPVYYTARYPTSASFNTSSFLLYGYSTRPNVPYFISLEGSEIEDISNGLSLNQSKIKSLGVFDVNAFPDVPMNGSVAVVSGLLTLENQNRVSAAYLFNNTWFPLLTAVDGNGDVQCIDDVVVQFSTLPTIRTVHPPRPDKSVKSTRHVVIISLCLSMVVMFSIMLIATMFEMVFCFLHPHPLAVGDYANYIQFEES